jgi:hypothetical protein
MNDKDLLTSVKAIMDVCLQGGHVKTVADAQGLVSLYQELEKRLLGIPTINTE